jgi:hypothetical protein
MNKRRIVLGTVVAAILILISTAWLIQTQFSSLQIQNVGLLAQNSQLESQNNDLQNQTIALQNLNIQLEDRINQLLEQLIIAQFNSTLREYNAYIQPFIFNNGTLTEKYEDDYSHPVPPRDTITSASNYAYALYNYYKYTGDINALQKVQTYMDAYMTDDFFRYDWNGVNLYYLPQWASNNTLEEGDPTPKLTMYAGVLAVELYEETGNETYKQFAQDIATEFRDTALVQVDNATDLAWSPCVWSYSGDLNETVGVNRQASIAWFFSSYAAINATYASYVPLILNWCYRAQLPNGGCSYNIGDANETAPYTAYQLYFALKAYENIPAVFPLELKTKMNNALNRILEYAPTNDHLANTVFSATLIEAIKSGFITNPSQTYITTTKTFLEGVFYSINYSDEGVVADGTNYGFRWSMYFLSALFSCYTIDGVFA